MKRKREPARDTLDAELLLLQRWFEGMAVASLICLALAIMGVFG